MKGYLTTEEVLLTHDNHLGDIWTHHYLGGNYSSTIEDWMDAREFFRESYISTREKQSLGEMRFSVPDSLEPGTEAYQKEVSESLDAGQIVLDSKWFWEDVLVRVPVLEKTSDGILATTVRCGALYGRSQGLRHSAVNHDAFERGLVALALAANGIPPVKVSSTAPINVENQGSFYLDFKRLEHALAYSPEDSVRSVLDDLHRVLADPLAPPETSEYCALLDEAVLTPDNAALKRVSFQTGHDWRNLDQGHLAMIGRLRRGLETNQMQVTPNFFGTSGSFLCFSADLMPFSSQLPDHATSGDDLRVTPRAIVAAWNYGNIISKMLFRLDDLTEGSEKIAKFKEKAGPFGDRTVFVEGMSPCGGDQMGPWFERKFGISHAKNLKSFFINFDGCVHPELVKGGFNLEAWTKAFLGTEATSRLDQARHPLKNRLVGAASFSKDHRDNAAMYKVDNALGTRAELFLRGIIAADKHLKKCLEEAKVKEIKGKGTFFEISPPKLGLKARRSSATKRK